MDYSTRKSVKAISPSYAPARPDSTAVYRTVLFNCRVTEQQTDGASAGVSFGSMHNGYFLSRLVESHKSLVTSMMVVTKTHGGDSTISLASTPHG